MSLSLVSGPASEPILLDEARSHVRLDIADDDSILQALIQAAREHVEGITNRALITQTWDQYRESLTNPIALDRNPVQSVTGVYYVTSLDGYETAASGNESASATVTVTTAIHGTTPASGTIRLNGKLYTYSGFSGSVFTLDVSVHASGLEEDQNSVSLYVERTLSKTKYRLDKRQEPVRIIRSPDVTYPDTLYDIDAVRIRFVAGYGDRSAIPQTIKQAILLLLGHLYENREMTAPITINSVPFTFDALLSPYRVW